MTKDRYLPSYRPVAKREDPHLPVPARTVTPEVVSRGALTLPPIDLGAFLTALHDVKPSDQLSFFDRWVEKHQLRRDAARMRHYRVFVDETEMLLRKAASAEITQRTLMTQIKTATLRAENDFKSEQLRSADLDAQIAEAQRRKRRADSDED